MEILKTTLRSLLPLLFYCLHFGKSEHSKNYTKIGDIMLGGLFPLHLYNETTGNCGLIRELASIKRLEAMVFTIKKINENSNILANISLGFEIYDTCSYSSETLKRSLNFIPKQRMNECDCQCSCLNDTEGECSEKVEATAITGVVGAQRSSSSLQAAVLFGLYNIPQISYLSTSDELSDKLKYKYFLRTVPPDTYQIQAIVDILIFYHWTYVSFVNSDDSYGEHALEEFKSRVRDLGICLATAHTISIHANKDFYDNVLEDLDSAKATVVILYAQLEVANGVFESVSRLAKTGRFIWIGSDGWGNYGTRAFKGHEEAALGSITFQPYSNFIPDFDEYFYSMTPANSKNPWLLEFWETYGNCSSDEPSIINPPCDEINLEPLANDTDIPAHDSLVMDAVLSFAYALDNMKSQQCQLGSGWCPDFTPYDGKTLMEFLLQTEFYSPSNDGMVEFDENGNTRPRYKIKNLQKINDIYKFVDIGSWREESKFIKKPDVEVKWYIDNTGSSLIPKSVCSEPCGIGYATIKSEETPCCWTCVQCPSSSIVVDVSSELGSQCKPCIAEGPVYYFPDVNRTQCDVVDGAFVTKDHPWAVVLITLSAVGILSTCATLVAYLKNRNTPLIKASSRELSYIIFCGIALGFVCAMFHGIRPSPAICLLRRVGLPISTTLIYASVTTKTVRVYRIFKASSKTARRPKYISSQSQVLIALSVATIQVLWMLIWLIIVPPTVDYVMPDVSKGRVVMICSAWDETADIEVIGALVFNIVLVLICCVYAFRTRRLPDNYKETRYINLCSFSTLVIILTFTPPYFTTEEPYYKAIYNGYGLIINDTITLICLFLVKIYALYFVNDEEMNIFTQTRIRVNSGVVRVVPTGVPDERMETRD